MTQRDQDDLTLAAAILIMIARGEPVEFGMACLIGTGEDTYYCDTDAMLDMENSLRRLDGAVRRASAGLN